MSSSERCILLALCSCLHHGTINDEKCHPGQGNPTGPIAQTDGGRIACTKRHIADNNLAGLVTAGSNSGDDDPSIGINNGRIVTAVIRLDYGNAVLNSAED